MDKESAENLATKIVEIFGGFGLLPSDVGINDMVNLKNAKAQLVTLLMGGQTCKKLESALKELRFAKCKPEDCGDIHSDEYRNRIRTLEHAELHIGKAISILEDLTKK